ncbi:MAG: hypothetical protein AAGF46_00280, partial [Pseudomonadota bacterium]
MGMLETLIASGRIVDLMLLVIAVEIVALIAYRVTTGRGLAVPALLLNVGAGGSLMVALRFVLTDAGTLAVAGALVAALVFHVGDLLWRWQESLQAGAT